MKSVGELIEDLEAENAKLKKAASRQSRSKALLASLSALAETWRTERDFLATGEGSDRTAATIYDECAIRLLEIVKANRD